MFDFLLPLVVRVSKLAIFALAYARACCLMVPIVTVIGICGLDPLQPA